MSAEHPASANLDFGCTLNTFDPALDPADILELIAGIGYRCSDLQCDGPFFPYSVETVERIRSVVEATGLSLECVNSMTASFFWREHQSDSRVMKHSGPDISDRPDAYARHGVADASRWRLERIESCMRLARELGVPRLNANVGTGIRVDREEAWPRVWAGLAEMERLAVQYGVQICLETEPSLFLRGRADVEPVLDGFPGGAFVWGYDIGHQIKLHRGDHAAVVTDIREMAGRIGYFHIEDISREDWEGDPNRHTHLCLGEGDIDFPPIWYAVTEARQQAVKAGRRIPLLYENYNAYDRSGGGSAASAYDQLMLLARPGADALALAMDQQ